MIECDSIANFVRFTCRKNIVIFVKAQTMKTNKATVIIFMLPGNTFSKEFLQAWSDLLFNLVNLGYVIKISCAYDANIFYARSRCLCTQTLRGTQQQPFNSKIEYDYLFWIDSDVIFTTKDVLQLLQQDKDIVSGCYIMHNNTHYPIVQHMDDEFYLKNGHYQFMDRTQLTELATKNELVEVDYVGFGFMCVKKGVFETLSYPYFSPVHFNFGTNHISEYASEDVSWCIHVKEKGFKVFVDPTVVVAHQKLIPLK